MPDTHSLDLGIRPVLLQYSSLFARTGPSSMRSHLCYPLSGRPSGFSQTQVLAPSLKYACTHNLLCDCPDRDLGGRWSWSLNGILAGEGVVGGGGGGMCPAYCLFSLRQSQPCSFLVLSAYCFKVWLVPGCLRQLHPVVKCFSSL